MKYCIILFLWIGSLTSLVHAQEWTDKDSTRLNRIMKAPEEIKLNPEAVRQIDFGSGTIGSPRMSNEKRWMLPDETLPTASPDELPLDKRQILSLHPYKANTPYDWDPIYRKKIKVGKDTWRGDPFYVLRTQFSYTNWAQSVLGAGIRRSLAEIEATGLRYNPLAERVNGMMVGGWQKTSKPSGIDLMTVFTKDFWDKKGNARRARTLEVLKTYGDTTTISISQPVLELITH